MRFPKATGVSATVQQRLQPQMMELCRSWLPPLRQNSLRTDTHDMGFILLPALRMDWELTGNNESLQAIITGANNLASRYSERTGAIRSWNQAKSNAYSITDMDKNFLIIIDSMCSKSCFCSGLKYRTDPRRRHGLVILRWPSYRQHDSHRQGHFTRSCCAAEPDPSGRFHLPCRQPRPRDRRSPAPADSPGIQRRFCLV